MGDFRRGLSDAFVDALGQLAQENVWWRDILADRSLIIGVRDDYLNVYWRGQSIFKVTANAGRINVATHPKYLLDPGLAGQIPFDWERERFGAVPDGAFLQTYDGPKTLKMLKNAAGLFSGDEKQGVHDIVQGNPHILDVEVAFDANHLDTSKNLPRLDLAALERTPDGYELAFWEAKRFANRELRAQGESVPVMEQIRDYEIVLDHYREQLLAVYRRVAQNLCALSRMSGGARPVGDHVRAVAEGAPLSMKRPPCLGLIIFDFDADQRDGAHWRVHAQKLKSLRLLARGSAKDIKLPD